MKIYHNAITSACLRGLDFLQERGFIKEFYLAGGTALALQIGHRISTDLDWFSSSQPLLASQREHIRLELSLGGDGELVTEQDGMMELELLQQVNS